jgi:hypothetical protein
MVFAFFRQKSHIILSLEKEKEKKGGKKISGWHITVT